MAVWALSVILQLKTTNHVLDLVQVPLKYGAINSPLQKLLSQRRVDVSNRERREQGWDNLDWCYRGWMYQQRHSVSASWLEMLQAQPSKPQPNAQGPWHYKGMCLSSGICSPWTPLPNSGHLSMKASLGKELKTATFISLCKDKGRTESKLFLLKSWINQATLVMSLSLALGPNLKLPQIWKIDFHHQHLVSAVSFFSQQRRKIERRGERGRRRWFRFDCNLAFICIFKLVKLWTVAKQWQRIFVIISLLGV